MLCDHIQNLRARVRFQTPRNRIYMSCTSTLRVNWGAAFHQRSPALILFFHLFKLFPSVSPDGVKLDCDSDILPLGVANVRDGKSTL